MRQVTRADEDLISAYGRLVEAHANLSRQLGRSLERQAGISQPWFEVLLRIERAAGGRIPMSTLAAQVALTTGGITRMVDRMTAAGLVRRVPSSTDRRVSFAELTTAGQDTLRTAKAVHADDLRDVFSSISANDRTTLARLLEELRTARTGPRAGG